MNKSSIDRQEINKFEQHAMQWWDKNGPLKTLHDINPLRLAFIQSMQSIAGKKILDVGCGGGVLTEAMARAGALCTGIDAERHAIASAAAHAAKEGLTIDYKASAIEDLQEGEFDIISCMEMLEHVQNPQLVIQHCARLLKPGGTLFLSTINRTIKAYASAILAAEYVLRLLPRQTHDYDKFISPSELAAIVRQENFQLLSLKGMNYNPFTRNASLTEDVSVNYLMACQLKS